MLTWSTYMNKYSICSGVHVYLRHDALHNGYKAPELLTKTESSQLSLHFSQSTRRKNSLYYCHPRPSHSHSVSRFLVRHIMIVKANFVPAPCFSARYHISLFNYTSGNTKLPYGLLNRLWLVHSARGSSHNNKIEAGLTNSFLPIVLCNVSNYS